MHIHSEHAFLYAKFLSLFEDLAPIGGVLECPMTDDVQYWTRFAIVHNGKFGLLGTVWR